MITSVKHLKDYKLIVKFEDGTIRHIDMYPFMSSSSHPLIRKFLSRKLFKNVRIEHGALAWGDNEFDINPESIYKGQFDC